MVVVVVAAVAVVIYLIINLEILVKSDCMPSFREPGQLSQSCIF